jgi:hypothetical protein
MKGICQAHDGAVNELILLVMPDLSIRRVCGDCIQFLWYHKNPLYKRQVDAETEEAIVSETLE